MGPQPRPLTHRHQAVELATSPPLDTKRIDPEKLAEWSDDRPDDPDHSGELGNTWGCDIAAQALLLGIERFLRLGYDVVDVRSFVDRALGSPDDH
ncbi:hypothetical protein [Kitasatospora sp. NPDC088346]|uniref:hypothetical protein n=1 Tax=Kitasatospora sp. NPDC088346 TaxID=3364073 RepID=UPI0038091928